MATSVWKGYLTFGLISIPIRLFSAARTGANQPEPAAQRARRAFECRYIARNARQVPRNEIVKGCRNTKRISTCCSDEAELDKIEPQSRGR